MCPRKGTLHFLHIFCLSTPVAALTTSAAATALLRAGRFGLRGSSSEVLWLADLFITRRKRKRWEELRSILEVDIYYQTTRQFFGDTFYQATFQARCGACVKRARKDVVYERNHLVSRDVYGELLVSETALAYIHSVSMPLFIQILSENTGYIHIGSSQENSGSLPQNSGIKIQISGR